MSLAAASSRGRACVRRDAVCGQSAPPRLSRIDAAAHTARGTCETDIFGAFARLLSNVRFRQRQSSWRVHRRSAVRHRRDARYGRADWRPCRDRYLRHGQRRAASLFSWWLPKPARGRSGHPMVPRHCARAAAVEQGRGAGRGIDQAKFAKLEAVGCPRAHDAIRTVLRFADTSEDSILLGSLESKRIHYGRAVARGK